MRPGKDAKGHHWNSADRRRLDPKPPLDPIPPSPEQIRDQTSGRRGGKRRHSKP